MVRSIGGCLSHRYYQDTILAGQTLFMEWNLLKVIIPAQSRGLGCQTIEAHGSSVQPTHANNMNIFTQRTMYLFVSVEIQVRLHTKFEENYPNHS